MSGDWVLDRGAQTLIDQVMDATSVARSDIGTIAGPNHRQSGPHFPEDPAPPGNPPHQVDAVDFPHQPDKGLDCEEFTEQLRLSRDPRLYLVIWNGRQFSSYAKNGVAPFTWRPYSGEDMHREHCHVEVNDQHHDETQPWKVFDMAYPTADEIAEALFRRTWREFVDADGNGQRDFMTLPVAVFATHANTVQLKATLADIQTGVRTLLTRNPSEPPAVEVPPLSLEQMDELVHRVVAGLSTAFTAAGAAIATTDQH